MLPDLLCTVEGLVPGTAGRFYFGAEQSMALIVDLSFFAASRSALRNVLIIERISFHLGSLRYSQGVTSGALQLWKLEFQLIEVLGDPAIARELELRTDSVPLAIPRRACAASLLVPKKLCGSVLTSEEAYLRLSSARHRSLYHLLDWGCEPVERLESERALGSGGLSIDIPRTLPAELGPAGLLLRGINLGCAGVVAILERRTVAGFGTVGKIRRLPESRFGGGLSFEISLWEGKRKNT
eukprot:IDg6359t1